MYKHQLCTYRFQLENKKLSYLKNLTSQNEKGKDMNHQSHNISHSIRLGPLNGILYYKQSISLFRCELF